MTTPADNKEVGVEPVGFADDSLSRCFVHDDDFCVRPPWRKRSSRAGRRILRTAIQLRQKN
jgi:hypothetical protein